MKYTLLLLAACSVQEATQEVAGIGGDLAEVSYCQFSDCGSVLLCTMPDGNKNEWCFPSDNTDVARAETGADSCEPTPRGGALGWPCIYECPSPAHGCNAYMGCWCP